MALEVVWTRVALDDLDAIAGYIAKDSPRYASAFVGEAQQTSRSLDRFPRRGRIVPELGEKSIRELVVTSYRMIYRFTEDRVCVIALVHAARDLGAFWKNEKR